MGMKAGWRKRFAETPDHALRLADYVGPFAVGPEGYRDREVATLARMFERDSARSASDMELPVLDLEERPEIFFKGRPQGFLIYAFDANSGEMVASMTPAGTYRDPACGHSSVTSEMHRLLARHESKSYQVLDFSIAGFYARVTGHGLVVNDALASGKDVPEEVMADYEMRGGKAVLTNRPTPEGHNEFWDVSPDPRSFRKEETSLEM